MTSRTEGMLRLYEVPGSDLSVLIEDDGRVAYAYLRRDGAIVADVWLYNVAATPEDTTWTDNTQMPFLNPTRYCTQETFRRIEADSEVSCTLVSEHVEVRVQGQLIARLRPGVKPGWSRLARISDPLAQPLDRFGT
jgi:hypothetical protein